MLVSYFLLWSKLFLSVNAFNIDVRHPIIIVNPDKLQNKTYFGYSLGLFSENSGGWITAIGAPATTKDGIANVGTLYTCPFLENCTEVHYKTISGYPHKLSGNSWIGGSIDVSNKFRKLCVSSFRWYQEVALPAPFIIMTGGLFLTNLNKTSVASLSPLKNDLHTSSKVFYYGEAAVGFSIHFPSNADELLLGAPGINNFLGSVVKIDNFFTKQHQVVEPAGDDYNELGGYSVTSGYFYNRNELYYATGAPRGTYGNGNTLNGLVVLFIVGYEFNRFGELRSITKAIISGTQVGEYFGASLGSGDLDSDGLTDLIIGAPFRKNGLDGYNHGSVYIYYGAKKRLKHNKETDKLDGTVSGGLFGSSIMYLSDINKDGYGEIAISAPYEDKTGAIYIYSYRKYQLILIQKILGKDVAPEIRGFGISFSRPADIDGNGFVDFAVGSYESGHVVLLRSQPVVAIIARLKTTQIPRHSKQSSFQVCFFYSDYNEEKLEITREVMLDKMLGRAQVLDKKEIFNITILYKKEKCETIKFAIKKNRINWREPITIAVSYHLVGELQQKPLAPIYIHPDIKVGNDTFCRSCPVLDESRSSKRTILGNMQWSQFCGNDNRACKSKLSIFGRFSKLGNNHSYVLGSSDFVTLNVEVENEGDPLYGTLLEITLPVSMGLRQKPSICQIELNNKVVCEIGDNGEELSKMFSHDFELDMRTINDGTERNQLNISLKAHSTSANQPTSVLNMTITLVRETDFIITGESVQQSYVYELGISMGTNSSIKIENVFKVEKFGVSPVSQVQIQLLIPHYIKRVQKFETFTKLTKFKGKLNQESILCSNNMSGKNNAASTESVVKAADIEINDETSITENSTFHLSCANENIACVVLNCTAGPFKQENRVAEFFVEINLDIQHLQDVTRDKNFILFMTSAHILVENLGDQKLRKKMATIANLLVIHRSRKVAMWILILSAISGFILLILFTCCLYKTGFFKRTNHIKLELLKQQAKEVDKFIADADQPDLEFCLLDSVGNSEEDITEKVHKS